MRFPEIGEVFAENYRIEKMLGSGGFSRVYMATQLDLDRAVAIKILQPPLHGSQSERERDEKLQGLISRFEREARMVSKLKSPHTITMYAYGQDNEGQLFMSIEYVDGRTLSELIRQEGALPPDRVTKILRQVLVSLYEAHDFGMLHRDIKPQNIMAYEHLGQKDQVKLLDFGIVKLIGTESARDQVDLTSDDTLVGTPRYMAPEYIRGEQLSASSDLYSLGLVMYELLVGERAIQADSSIQIIGKQLERESFYLPSHLGQLDVALRSIVNGMLEKNTRLRYATAAQVLQDLDARELNRHIAPPNAPAFQPPHRADPTGRLNDAIVERRRADQDLPPLPTSQPPSLTPPSLIKPLPLSSMDAPEATTFGVEPLATREPSKQRVAMLAVLLIFLIGGVGTLVAITLGHDNQTSPPRVDPSPPQQIATSKATSSLTRTKEDDPPPETLPETPEITEPVNTIEAPVSNTLPIKDDALPSEDLPLPDTSPETPPQKERAVRQKPVKSEVKKTPANPPTADPREPKTDKKITEPKTDPYKIIIAE